MRWIIFLSVALASACALGANTNLPITHVTVFAGKAEITRSGPVRLEPGATAIELTGLPWDLDPASLVAGTPTPGIRVRRVEIEPVYDRLVRDEQTTELREQVDQLNARLDEFSAQAERLRHHMELARGFSIQSPPVAADAARPVPPLAPREWMQVLDFAGEAVENAASDRMEVQRQIADETLKLEVLATRLERLASKDSRRYRNVTIVLEAPEATNTLVAVSYLVSGPEWFPRYEARADVPTGLVRIRAYGLVRQQTGEDWVGALVTLATVDLEQSATPPQLATVRYMPDGMLVALPDRIVQRKSDERRAELDHLRHELERNALLVSAAELADQRGQVAGMQTSLGLARGKLNRADLVQAGLRSSAPKSTAPNGDAEQAPALQTPDESALAPQQARFGQLRSLYRQQNEALKTGDYDKFALYNRDIDGLFRTLPDKQQSGLLAIRDEADANVAKAQRLIKSRTVAKTLTPPTSAAGGVDYRFDCQGAVTVHSEWVLTKVPYLDTTVAVDLVHETAPSEREAFYLIAEGRNTVGQPLLPGPMAIFIGPDFVGESTLGFRAGGAPLRFELGIDRDVTVTRRFERLRETTGLILANHEYSYEVSTQAVNRKDRPVRVRVFDRYPFAPQDADVDVIGFSATPAPNSTTRHHLLRWDANIPPGGTYPITFKYLLKHRRNTVLAASEGSPSW
jgi:hypothetical protein